MGELPRGTVTFLFTDVEGSTRRWEHDSPAMLDVVERHFTLLDEAIAAVPRPDEPWTPIEAGTFVEIPTNVLALLGISGGSYVISKAVGKSGNGPAPAKSGATRDS